MAPKIKKCAAVLTEQNTFNRRLKRASLLFSTFVVLEKFRTWVTQPPSC